MPSRFGPASVQYGDWSGTVSLDSPDDHEELYRIAGVDPDTWKICGIDIFGGAGMGIRASVLAVRRDLIDKFDDWARVAQENGGAIPVTEFELREGTALGFLGAFKRSNVRATLRHAIAEPGLELELVDTVYPPEE